jgi:hypothetical protein
MTPPGGARPPSRPRRAWLRLVWHFPLLARSLCSSGSAAEPACIALSLAAATAGVAAAVATGDVYVGAAGPPACWYLARVFQQAVAMALVLGVSVNFFKGYVVIVRGCVWSRHQPLPADAWPLCCGGESGAAPPGCSCPPRACCGGRQRAGRCLVMPPACHSRCDLCTRGTCAAAADPLLLQDGHRRDGSARSQCLPPCPDFCAVQQPAARSTVGSCVHAALPVTWRLSALSTQAVYPGWNGVRPEALP